MFWNGGKNSSCGYSGILFVGHPRADKNGYVKEHILVAEKAFGKHIPHSAVVHHIDRNRKNNSNDNLVLCQNGAYHSLLHRRQRAYDACGNANWRKCPYCGEYDDPKNMYEKTGGRQYHHIECHKKYMNGGNTCR